MSTIQDKQDLTVTVTTPEQDAPLSSAAPQMVAAGEDLPEAAAEKAAPVMASATESEQTAPLTAQEGAVPSAQDGEAAIPEPPADSPLAQALAKAQTEAGSAATPASGAKA